MKFNRSLISKIEKAASEAVKESVNQLHIEINDLIDSPKTGKWHFTYFLTDEERPTPHHASAPNEPFASDSGYAQSHIKQEMNGKLEGRIAADYEYAWRREFGFIFPEAPSAGKPRPVFTPAVDNISPIIPEIFKEKISKAIND